MRKQQAHVEIKQIDRDQLELCYYGNSREGSYRSWKMLRRHAEDLRVWWQSEGSHFGDGESPILNRRSGNVLVSMTVPTLVEVRMLDEWGKLKTVGCALPRAVVEYLTSYLNTSLATETATAYAQNGNAHNARTDQHVLDAYLLQREEVKPIGRESP